MYELRASVSGMAVGAGPLDVFRVIYNLSIEFSGILGLMILMVPTYPMPGTANLTLIH